MTTYTITLNNNYSSSIYINYSFNSFSTGVGGEHYAIASDGVYLLEGDDDNGTDIAATVDYGDLKFGSSAMKGCPEFYITTDCGEPVTLTVNGYEYDARFSSDGMEVQRVDTGKGLRANFFSVQLANKNGADFDIESIEAMAVETTRRI